MAADTGTDRKTTPHLERATLVAKSDAAYDLKYYQNVDTAAAEDTVKTGYSYGL